MSSSRNRSCVFPQCSEQDTTLVAKHASGNAHGNSCDGVCFLICQLSSQHEKDALFRVTAVAFPTFADVPHAILISMLFGITFMLMERPSIVLTLRSSSRDGIKCQSEAVLGIFLITKEAHAHTWSSALTTQQEVGARPSAARQGSGVKSAAVADRPSAPLLLQHAGVGSGRAHY